MYIKQFEECKYYRDIDLGNKHLLGSRWSGYCSYHPRTTRGQLRNISRISNCKIRNTGEGDNKVNNKLNEILEMLNTDNEIREYSIHIVTRDSQITIQKNKQGIVKDIKMGFSEENETSNM